LFTVTFAKATHGDRLTIGEAMSCLQFPLVSLLVNNDHEKTLGPVLKAVAKQNTE
jgi:hypothetical protein